MNPRPELLINITIPVYNEEKALPRSISRLAVFCESHCGYRHEIVIANNASTDRTLEVARCLEAEFKTVRVLNLTQKGRGRAVKRAWRESEADILSYMDVDLSSDLTAFPTLVGELISGRYDLATGSRLLDSSLVERGIKREFISRSYNLLVKATFRTRFSDAQCGFKAITKMAASELLPLVEDDKWFMDTELLVLAEKLGYRIFDLPIRWVDDLDSRVKIVSTAIEDIRGLIRLHGNLKQRKAFHAARPRLREVPVASHDLRQA